MGGISLCGAAFDVEASKSWQLHIWDRQHSTTFSVSLQVTQPVFCCLGNDRLLVVDDGLKLCLFEDMIADMFLIVFPIAVPLSG